MKVVIVTIPMKAPKGVAPIHYPVDGNKNLEYDGEVRYPLNGILSKVLKKGEKVKIILLLVTGGNSCCEENAGIFRAELAKINEKIGADLSYAPSIEIPFLPVKATYNQLLVDFTERIPKGAEIYADITYGAKPEILSLLCAFCFVENFCDAAIGYLAYGKVEFNPVTKELEHPMIFDLSSLYYLFKLIGSMEAPDLESASRVLKEFLA
jgi:hypothetical protein